MPFPLTEKRMKIERLQEVDSTNLYIRKYLSGGENIAVVSDVQTSGRGTKGRSFSSRKGGIYLSVLTFYGQFPASDSFLVMMNAAVAVCRTARAFGVDARIKWPNDVLVGEKKLCGILIENSLSGSNLRASIVGIGLNVCNDLSDVRDIATSLSEEVGRTLSVEEVFSRLMCELEMGTSVEEYRSYLAVLGKRVRVCEGEKSYLAQVEDVLPDGRLCVVSEGKKMILSAAEITLRLMENKNEA